MRAANSCSRRTPTTWSPALATFLLERRDHREDTFYTAGMRFDTALPERPTHAASALAEIVERAHDDERLASVYAPTRPHRPEAFEQAVAAFGGCEHGDDGTGSIPGYQDFHAGDFSLRRARSGGGARLSRGAVEPDHSAILCKFYGAGLRNACRCRRAPSFTSSTRSASTRTRCAVDSDAGSSSRRRAAEIHAQREPTEWGGSRRWSTDTASGVYTVDR